MADIQQMLRLPGIDEDEVRNYFEHFGQLEKYHELAGKMGCSPRNRSASNARGLSSHELASP